MSDTDNDIKPETAAAAGGFTPEPPPPQLDAAAASDALADEQQAGESGSVTVPNDAPSKQSIFWWKIIALRHSSLSP